MAEEKRQKNDVVRREEKTLAFWNKNKIFQKSLDKPSPEGEFVFYEGPPTANGRPGIHHVLARAFKDCIPRFKTMQGYHVRRKGGWDTHGLPVELQVEKELGLKSKKDIESYGIAAFNRKCKESVWTYVDEWERFTDRIAFWIDQKNAYITYTPEYIESLWSIIAKIYTKGLLYKDYKVLPWCPRCGTALSSHELAQGYKQVSEKAVYVKFKAVDADEYFIAWTTTPWTLPGNVALAVKKDVEYIKIKTKHKENIIIAKDRVDDVENDFEIVETITGKELIGRKYEPLYPYLKKYLRGEEREKLDKAYQIYEADFVTTKDGTGIVHTAVMYGADDFVLGTKVGLPKQHLIDESGKFLDDMGFLSGKFVKSADKDIISDLANRKLLLKQEVIEHTYPFCWRCSTPLLYFARDSWYIRMSDLKKKLLQENKKIHWEPEHIQEGRFGEWLREVKDWAISRERYWGTPLPIWKSNSSDDVLVIDSIKTLKKHSNTSKNTYYMMRHGESESNTEGVISSRADNPHSLTECGRVQVRKAASILTKKKIDYIIVSPFVRTRETADILTKELNIEGASVIVDDRLGEINLGILNNKPISEYRDFAPTYIERFIKSPSGGESLTDVRRRIGPLLYDIDRKYKNKNILFITHEYPAWMLATVAEGADQEQSILQKEERNDFLITGEVRELPFAPLPHNENFELDLHRPYIDDIEIISTRGEKMSRVSEVIDVWFDSGAMPFAQDHYPMENKDRIEGFGYPADFISEAIDQTRGWFYTLHAVGILMGRGRAYNNVISLGHILDTKGKKMSKSVGNVVDPWKMIDTYGADALRFWMYTVNQPGDSKNFDEKGIDEISKKVFRILENVERFYSMFSSNRERRSINPHTSPHVLDIWILTHLDALIRESTSHLNNYRVFEPTRSIREFILDLSQWYVRRSRDRFKSEGSDKEYAAATLGHVLLELSKLMAPFTPFFAEYLYQKMGGGEESVHLDSWPAPLEEGASGILRDMADVRAIVSLALLKRAEAGIKVRQPLALLKLKTKNEKLKSNEALLQLIKDEVNVKRVAFEDSLKEDVVLETTLTPQLKEEGAAREFIRYIQNLRKKKGLIPRDGISLIVDTDEKGKEFIQKFENEIRSTASIDLIVFSETKGKAVTVHSHTFTVSISE